MKHTFLALALAGIATPAAAQDIEVWALGGNIFEDAPQNHLHFGPVVLVSQPESSSGGGLWTEGGISYGPGTYNISFVLQNIEVDRGVPFSAGVSPEMGIEGTILDLAYSRDAMLGGLGVEWSVGLRYAEFDTSTDNFAPDTGPLHQFTGTGLRVGAATGGDIDAMPGLAWFGAGGLSVLPGTIETSPRPGWLCGDCTSTDVTAIGADIRLGAEYELTDGLSLVGGYQAQLWQDVTVEISDNSSFGGNQGSSDLLIHGVFLGLAARW